MNYLAEILAFNNWKEFNSQITKTEICLWYELINMANRFGWGEFTVPISTLISKSKLTKNDIYRSRNKLKQFGLIAFKERSGNQASVYKINSIVSLYGTQTGTQVDTQSMTQVDTQVGNINKTKNQKLETKKESIAKAIPKNQRDATEALCAEPNLTPAKLTFGEFKNVLLTKSEFKRLENDYEADLPGIIEHFSSYIEMKGYKAKSHNLAIRNWVATAYREKKQRELALKNREETGIFANKNSGKHEYFQNDSSAQKWLDQAKKSGY